MAAAADYATTVPDLIKQYVVYFYRHIRCRPRPCSRPELRAKEPWYCSNAGLPLARRLHCSAQPLGGERVRACVPLRRVTTAQSGPRCVCQALQE